MADSSLDDFFAKKDKNRKIKKKYLTPEEIAKQLEEGKQTETNAKSKKDKEKTCPVNTSVASKLLEQDSDEWKDVEYEPQKDYSGLRIQVLNLKDKEEELRDQKLQENGQESKRDDVVGPWKVKPPSPVPEVDPVVENVSSKEETTTTTTTSSRYVPPALRNQASRGSSTLEPTVIGRRTWKSAAPQIDNESEFPTLGLEVDNKNAFQTVRHSSRNIPTSHNAPLDIENKFNALSSRNREDEYNSD